MSMISQDSARSRRGDLGLPISGLWGLIWLTVATFAAGAFFIDGLDALLTAWALPEYSHGPLIPVLSALLFLRQLKEYPPQPGSKGDRWPGVMVIVMAFLFGAVGKLSGIDDLVAYATIIWVGGILLVSFGWQTGKHFWPPVLHLVYMLPLPGVIYFKLTNGLQLISSEIGVWLLQLMSVPVYLEGNIIDLGVIRLHVADACSGLRYLFPIMSFSYIFAVLYRGPMWHKAMLLLAAVPITILMNSIRIAIAGVIANAYGVEWLEGFTHFFEGWVIFVICILLLFLLAWAMLLLLPKDQKMTLPQALDLDTDGLSTQALRLRLVQPSAALVIVALIGTASLAAWHSLPDTRQEAPVRTSFASFPQELGDWQQEGPPEILGPRVARSLGADDYHSVTMARGVEPGVGLFMAWYDDQTRGGVHSPEICLPGSGWEIAWLERTDIAKTMGTPYAFNINRAIIERGETRMMVYYWFQQGERRLAWDFAAKFYLMIDGITTGSTDGALIRLTTFIDEEGGEVAAEARLQGMLAELQDPLPRFIPDE
jgi:exosortase D (VPLPA-CTERM-specific)